MFWSECESQTSAVLTFDLNLKIISSDIVIKFLVFLSIDQKWRLVFLCRFFHKQTVLVEWNISKVQLYDDNGLDLNSGV